MVAALKILDLVCREADPTKSNPGEETSEHRWNHSRVRFQCVCHSGLSIASCHEEVVYTHGGGAMMALERHQMEVAMESDK